MITAKHRDHVDSLHVPDDLDTSRTATVAPGAAHEQVNSDDSAG